MDRGLGEASGRHVALTEIDGREPREEVFEGLAGDVDDPAAVGDVKRCQPVAGGEVGGRGVRGITDEPDAVRCEAQEMAAVA